MVFSPVGSNVLTVWLPCPTFLVLVQVLVSSSRRLLLLVAFTPRASAAYILCLPTRRESHEVNEASDCRISYGIFESVHLLYELSSWW